MKTRTVNMRIFAVKNTLQNITLQTRNNNTVISKLQDYNNNHTSDYQR